jgi:hypothetical protein
MLLQIELAKQSRCEPPRIVATDIGAEARVKLFGRVCATEALAPVHNHHAFAALGKEGRSGQSVGTGANDDCVVDRHG